MMNPRTTIGLMLMLSVAFIKSNQQQETEVSAFVLQPWQSIGSFNAPRSGHCSVTIGNKIYILGGLTVNGGGDMRYNDVQFFAVNTNNGQMVPGSLTTTAPFSIPRSNFAAAFYNNYIYIVGGFAVSNELDDVEYARVGADGTISAWTTSPSKLNYPRSHHQLQVIQAGGKVYLAAIAGSNTVSNSFLILADTVEVAEINADGSVGAWSTCLSHVKGGRQSPSTNIIGGYLYIAGGRGTVSVQETFSDIQYAAIQDDGCPGPWATSTNPLRIPVYGHTSMTLNSNSFIVLGGSGGDGNFFNNLQFTSLYSGDTDIKGWKLLDTPFLTPRYGHTSTQIQGIFVYVIGGRTTGANGDSNDIQMTAIISQDTRSEGKYKRQPRKQINNKQKI